MRKAEQHGVTLLLEVTLPRGSWAGNNATLSLEAVSIYFRQKAWIGAVPANCWKVAVKAPKETNIAKATAPQSVSAPSIIRTGSVHGGFSTSCGADILSIKTSWIIHSNEGVVGLFWCCLGFSVWFFGGFYSNFPAIKGQILTGERWLWQPLALPVLASWNLETLSVLTSSYLTIFSQPHLVLLIQLQFVLLPLCLMLIPCLGKKYSGFPLMFRSWPCSGGAPCSRFPSLGSQPPTVLWWIQLSPPAQERLGFVLSSLIVNRLTEK